MTLLELINKATDFIGPTGCIVVLLVWSLAQFGVLRDIEISDGGLLKPKAKTPVPETTGIKYHEADPK